MLPLVPLGQARFYRPRPTPVHNADSSCSGLLWCPITGCNARDFADTVHLGRHIGFHVYHVNRQHTALKSVLADGTL